MKGLHCLSFAAGQLPLWELCLFSCQTWTKLSLLKHLLANTVFTNSWQKIFPQLLSGNSQIIFNPSTIIDPSFLRKYTSSVHVYIRRFADLPNASRTGLVSVCSKSSIFLLDNNLRTVVNYNTEWLSHLKSLPIISSSTSSYLSLFFLMFAGNTKLPYILSKFYLSYWLKWGKNFPEWGFFILECCWKWNKQATQFCTLQFGSLNVFMYLENSFLRFFCKL